VVSFWRSERTSRATLDPKRPRHLDKIFDIYTNILRIVATCALLTYFKTHEKKSLRGQGKLAIELHYISLSNHLQNMINWSEFMNAPKPFYYEEKT